MISSVNFGTNPITEANRAAVKKPGEKTPDKNTNDQGDRFVRTSTVSQEPPETKNIPLKPVVLNECGETTGSNA